MTVKRIRSRDNPLFKSLLALAEDPREVRQQGRTLLDGVHLVAAALARGMPVQHVLLAESALASPEIARVLQAAPGIARIEFSDALFRALSGVSAPVGIAAVMSIPAPGDSVDATDIVVLDAVQDAGNVGTLLRTAAAAGISHVILGQGCAGAWTPRVLRAGQGAHFALQIQEGLDVPAWLQEHPARRAASIATVASEGGDVFATDLSSPTVWLLGNEGRGLHPALIGLAARRVTIPLARTTESLNVAAAAAICLFEMRRQRQYRRVTSADFSSCRDVE